ncbi:NADH-quinone oxidoreductase subunit C [Alicyclobacillus tolerans]|uniref:NADH-quinone oxidoreductase n=1 Tax=Alicyclobacillus tolerans TaxID=90970 RepID=A0A1M6TC54_9BACL|nr:NADH-quinone oxidoreductase subunit C [Alicyclobacillus montanus]SHK54565.1 NADH-quinone oxidoreductase subunit C [Alicyclobacillus montanus]
MSESKPENQLDKKESASKSHEAEVEANPLADDLVGELVRRFGESYVIKSGMVGGVPSIQVDAQQFVTVHAYLKQHPNWQLNYQSCYTGVDYGEELEVVSYVRSSSLLHMVCLKTRVSKESPRLPTLTTVHPGANWEEREMFDLLGIEFAGHPDLRRIMLWEGYAGHPLRKDFVEPQEESYGPST